MENEFFHNLDNELLEKMKAELAAGEEQTALIAATGIDDVEVIRHLMDQGISSATLASIGLIPLVAVAWADGKMDVREREAILQAARETGIGEGHSSYKLISKWLRNPPSDDLLASWKDYVAAMKETLDATAVSQIRKSVLDRARIVANAAGGFLGVARTSEAEQKVIDELESVFT